MARKPQVKDHLRLRQPTTNPSISLLVAERDDELENYYVAPDRFASRARTIGDPAVFFIGPKGIGKSAILQMVRLTRISEGKRVINITPDDLAFSSLASVEASSFLVQDPSKKQHVYKVLWDYILALEIIRQEYQDEGALLRFLRGFVASQHEQRARHLLKISLDQEEGRPDTFSSRMMKLLALIKDVELSGEAKGVKLSGKVGLDHDQAERPVAQNTMLSLVHNVAKHIGDNLKHPYYVLIDDLDLLWEDHPIQNDFIAALFQSLKNFSRPPNLKCVVALREQIFRSLTLPDKDKLYDWICQVIWDKDSVRQMVEERVVFKLNCQKGEVWGGLFPPNSFDLIWRNTSGTPREVLRLADMSIARARADGATAVSEGNITAAAIDFSNSRIDELASDYPTCNGIHLLLRRFNGVHKEFELGLIREHAEMIALEIECGEGPALKYTWAGGFSANPQGLARILLECGVLLVKPNRKAEPRRYDPITFPELTNEMWFAFNPMYALGLGLKGSE